VKRFVSFWLAHTDEKTLISYLIKQQRPYHCAHPSKVYHFAKGKGCFAKTDKIDAKILASYGQQPEIVAQVPDSTAEIKMREISARKTQVKTLLGAERQRLKHIYMEPYVSRSIKRTIKQLQQELTYIQKQLEKVFAKDEGIEKKRLLLETVKGVGKEVSTTLITDLPELGGLSR